MTRLARALALAEKYRVIPLTEEGQPRFEPRENATMDRNQIRAWGRRFGENSRFGGYRKGSTKLVDLDQAYAREAEAARSKMRAEGSAPEPDEPPPDEAGDPGPVPDPKKPKDPKRVSLLRLSEVTPLEVEWLWPGRVPFGGITNIEGDPGSTKSTLTLDVVARASLGMLPTPGSSPLRSLVISTEDDLARVVVPRLMAAGANLELVSSHDVDSEDAIWDLVKDLATLEALLIRSEARVLVLDPLVSILGAVDSHKDAEVRRALRPLDQLAKRRGVAVLAVRHLRKNAEGSALHAGGGSVGFTGIARAAYLVARHPEDPQRFVMAPTKSSYGPIPKSLAYSLMPTWPTVPGGHLRIGWVGECDLTAEDLRRPKPGPAAERSVEALDWLRAQLADGPVKLTELRQRAERDGIAFRTVERVRKLARVQIEGSVRDRTWRLPPSSAKSARTPEDLGGDAN